MRIFVVGRGDSLCSISRRFSVSEDELADINAISYPRRLAIGQAIVIPERETPTRTVELTGSAYPSVDASTLNAALPHMSCLCPFSHRVTWAGELIPINDSQLMAAASEHCAVPLLCVTNIGDDGGYSGDIAHRALTVARDRFIESVLHRLSESRSRGLLLMLEYVHSYDREALTSLLALLSEHLHSQGCYLYAAVAPRSSDDDNSFVSCSQDYAAYGRYCDRVVIMTYDFGYAYSPPAAISPIQKVRDCLSYATKHIASGKILMGLSYHCCNRALPWRQCEAVQVMSCSAAVSLAASAGAEIRYDTATAAPHFEYRDPCGVAHELWFEDARSLRAKLSLLNEFSLGGLYLPTLGGSTRQQFYIINSMFNTEKII